MYWHRLNPKLSWMGRISAVKMKVLPKLLFVFQTMITVVPQKWIFKIPQMLNNFIWAGKKAKMKVFVLQATVKGELSSIKLGSVLLCFQAGLYYGLVKSR